MDRNFINPKLSAQTLDRFLIRTKIYEFITRSLPLLNGNLLDVGCGKMPYREYILNNAGITKYVGLDIPDALEYDTHVSADITWDGTHMPIEANQYQAVMATEVLEHCPEPKLILAEINRVLAPSGLFIFTVPFLWNLHEAPRDEYRYTPFALQRLLTEAGFKDINITPTGGWHASMAQMLGLWACRAPMHHRLRPFIKACIKPLYKLLLKKDRVPANLDGLMIPGICGIAYKK